MRVAYRDDMPERIEICPRFHCRVIELPIPSLRILNVRVMIQPREVTGPAQRDLQMGGEYSSGSHRQKLVLFQEDSSNLRVSMSTHSLEPMRDQRASMRSLFMLESRGLRFYGLLKAMGMSLFL